MKKLLLLIFLAIALAPSAYFIYRMETQERQIRMLQDIVQDLRAEQAGTNQPIHIKWSAADHKAPVFLELNAANRLEMNRLSATQRRESADSAVPGILEFKKVPHWMWAEVANEEPVRSGNTTFSRGDRCGLIEDATLFVIGRDSTIVLAKYYRDGTAYGTPCPKGTEVLLPAEVYDGLDQKWAEKEAEKEEKEERIRQMRQQQP